MNRLIVFVAVALCAGCAQTSSTRKVETDQLAADVLLGDSQGAMCAQSEIRSCREMTGTRVPGARARERCECVPMTLFDGDRPETRGR
jgi:hypothetical protein